MDNDRLIEQLKAILATPDIGRSRCVVQQQTTNSAASLAVHGATYDLSAEFAQLAHVEQALSNRAVKRKSVPCI